MSTPTTTIKSANDLESLVYYSNTPVDGLVNIKASETSCNRLGYALAELEAYPSKAEQLANNAIRIGRQDPKRGLIWTLAVLHEVEQYLSVKDMKRWDKTDKQWVYDTSLNISVGLARKEFPETKWEDAKLLGIPKHVFMGLLLLGKEINIVGDPEQAGVWVENGMEHAEDYLAENFVQEKSLPLPVIQHPKRNCTCGSFLRKDGGCTKCEKKAHVAQS
jgi:hypothetical protein